MFARVNSPVRRGNTLDQPPALAARTPRWRDPQGDRVQRHDARDQAGRITSESTAHDLITCGSTPVTFR